MYYPRIRAAGHRVFFVILTVPSLLILDFPKIAMVPLLFFIPTIIFARFWLGAMWKQPLGLNISWGRLALFVANFAILCLAAVYSYNHGLRPVREPVLNTFGFNILAAISALAFCLAASGEPRPVSALMSGLLLAALAICSLDLALHLGGYVNPGSAWQPQTKTPGLFFTLLGFKAHRVMMPLSSAFQNGAVVPTLLCVIAMGAGGRWVWLRGAAFGLGLLLLLLLDTRMFILAIAIAFLSRVLSRIPWALAATALALPWLEVAVVVYADLFPSVAEIAGGRSTAYGLFSGRQFIWEKVLGLSRLDKVGPAAVGKRAVRAGQHRDFPPVCRHVRLLAGRRPQRDFGAQCVSANAARCRDRRPRRIRVDAVLRGQPRRNAGAARRARCSRLAHRQPGPADLCVDRGNRNGAGGYT
ncbi:hypothetical protein ACFSTD_11185 [Novosphingobium colocasiae]